MNQKVIYKLLESLQIPTNCVLMLHSAFKGLARDGYQAQEVLTTIIDYMQPGTLVLPSMSWRYVNQTNPYFNELTTPCNTGILTKLFRTKYATHRSIHPTHSVCAIGKEAEEITASHHMSVTPCDMNSPFRKVELLNGHIIMLGVGIDCCTLIHSAEESIAPQVYVKHEADPVPYHCVTKDNTKLDIVLRRHQFLPRNYWLVQDTLAEDDKLKIYSCDTSVALGFMARDLFLTTCNLLKHNNAALIAQPGQRYRMM